MTSTEKTTNSQVSGDVSHENMAKIVAGYAFSGPVIELGALTGSDGAASPNHKIRVPVSIMNRHGLVAGATGTGKTKTLQVMAEQLSAAGVPVFLADIKGDLSGMAVASPGDDKVVTRAKEVGQEFAPTAFPCEFYALGGKGSGTPVRATISAFGPTLLSKVLRLNDVQESSLNLVFHYADHNNLPLLDLKDLRSVIQYLASDEGDQALKSLGGLSRQTAGVLLRELIAFADSGADAFFGEPEFDTRDFLRTVDVDGSQRGVVSIVELPGVQQSPELFSTFLMWFVADLFADLPEVGDIDKPKLVFFLDEAHLLFKDASKDFLSAITQTVRLIRSKGVGIFFVTQSPKDVPGDVLAQLGNRVQHALRAHTPDDAKALRAAVSTFPHSEYNLEKVLTELGIGEAIVTVLSEKGVPTPVARTKLRAPMSSMSPIPSADLDAAVAASPQLAKYGKAVDRESAYELLLAKMTQAKPAPEQPTPSSPPKTRPRREEPGAAAKILGSKAVTSFIRSAASAAGREFLRGVFGIGKRNR